MRRVFVHFMLVKGCYILASGGCNRQRKASAMNKRVLVLSASVGAGHVRAAEALARTCHKHYPEIEIENRDVLDFTNAMFRRIYAQAYLDLVARAPHVLGFLYDWLDQPSRGGRTIADRLRQSLQRLNLKRLEQFLIRGRWDLVINTHFLPAELIGAMRKAGTLRIAQVTVCTDFETHRLWVNNPCEHYFAATEDGAHYLAHWGVPSERISVTGIPVHPAFAEPRDRAACRMHFKLDPDRPLILQMCGGFGVGPVEQIAQHLLSVETPMQLAVICGKNDRLRGRVAQLSCPKRHRLLPIGFTTDMDRWMAAADLLVSKPGGLTTSESLASGLPMVVINPIPGQESRNSDFLLENGAAIKANHPVLLGPKVARLFKEPKLLTRMGHAAATLGRPNAALDVLRTALRHCVK